jgi:hypothetical protein
MKPKKNVVHAKIADFVRRHPEMTYDRIGKLIGMSLAQVSLIARKHGIHRGSDVKLTPELARILES